MADRSEPRPVETGLAELGAWRFRPRKPAPGLPLVVFSGAGREARIDGNIESLAAIRASRRPVLHFTDRAFSFYAVPGMADRLAEIVRAELAELGAQAAITIGISHGGFGAIAFATRFPVRFALAIAPRYSPLRGVVPDKRRFPWSDRPAACFPFATLDAGIAAATEAAILHGTLDIDDRRHLRRIPAAPNLDHWLVPRVGHRVAEALREAGHYRALFNAAAAADRARLGEVMEAAGAVLARSAAGRLRLLSSYLPARLHELRTQLRKRAEKTPKPITDRGDAAPPPAGA